MSEQNSGGAMLEADSPMLVPVNSLAFGLAQPRRLGSPMEARPDGRASSFSASPYIHALITQGFSRSRFSRRLGMESLDLGGVGVDVDRFLALWWLRTTESDTWPNSLALVPLANIALRRLPGRIALVAPRGSKYPSDRS